MQNKMEAVAFLTSFHFPNLFLSCRGAKPCTTQHLYIWSAIMVLMGWSWHTHGSNSVQPYFWILIALLGMLSPLQCAYLYNLHNAVMAIILVIVVWLSYTLSDPWLALAALWIIYMIWCMLRETGKI